MKTDLNGEFIRAIKFPEAIREEISKFISPNLNDVICVENLLIGRKDFTMKREDSAYLLEGNPFNGLVNSFINHCYYKKNPKVKILMFKYPTWIENVGIFGSSCDKYFCFYHKKHHHTIVKNTGKSFLIRRVDGTLYMEQNHWKKNYIRHYVRDKENFQKIYDNTIGFLLGNKEHQKKRGVGIYGEPGDGKTFLIKDIVEECLKNRIHVGIVELGDIRSPSDFAKYLNVFARKFKPSLLVMEDIHTFLEDASQGGDNPILKGLLNFLDGFYERDNNVVIVTTNNIETLDKAVKRPGRLDYFMEIREPNDNTKAEYLRKRGIEASLIPEFIESSSKFTFAMLYELVNRSFFSNGNVRELAKEILDERKATNKIGFNN